jgi:hypothetical protein
MTMKRLLMLLAATALALGVPVLSSAPASATSYHLCEVYGNNYCLGAADLNVGTAVTERVTGRDIEFKADGHYFDGYPTGTLKFTGATNRCAVSETYPYLIGFHVDVNYCSGVNGGCLG